MILWKYIKKHLLENPTQMVSENSAKLTFEELVIWAEEFAEKLKNIQCCAVLCESEMSAAMSILACFAAEVAISIFKTYKVRQSGSLKENPRSAGKEKKQWMKIFMKSPMK